MTESEQRHFEVLLEDIKHSVETIAEGHIALDGKIDRFHKEAKEDHQLAMDLINFSHDELKEGIQGVRTGMRETRDELSAKIEAVGDKVDGHEDRIQLLERKAA